MSFIYIWKSENIAIEDASSKFEAMIRHQTDIYSYSFGRKFSCNYKKIGSIFIGQIDFIKGIKDWKSWVECDNYGVAWSGVCETFLGVDLNRQNVKRVHDIALHTPEEIVEWDGHFAFATWDSLNNTVTITAGATQSQPLWYSSGVNGWACGSRSVPVLDIIGESKEFDYGQAGLYLISSYNMTGGTFFKKNQRLGARNQVLIHQSDPPLFREYISIFGYLTSNIDTTIKKDEIYKICSERLKDRVSRQFRYSENPGLELSGGMDSRCIGAALYSSGNIIRAHTGGAKRSPELKIAEKVAKKLEFKHSKNVKKTDLLFVLNNYTERSRKWIRFSEGLETIRPGLNFQNFFNGELPVLGQDAQYFNGLHFGMLKSKTLNWTTKDKILNRLHGKVKNYPGIDEMLNSIFNQIDRNLPENIGEENYKKTWSFMFYWQLRGSIWGSNVMSVKQPIGWWWNPLFDRKLVQLSWLLINENIQENELINEMTLNNAPHLSSIPYNYQLSSNQGYLSLLRKKIKYKLLNTKIYEILGKNGYYFDEQYFPVSVKRGEMWKSFFKKNNYAWRDLVNEGYVQELIERKPNAAFLWSLATIELFLQEYF